MAVNSIVPEVDVKTATDTINAIRGLVYNPISDAHGMGAFDAERLATTWKWTAKAQSLDETSFDPETAISRDYK
jgi:NitT/TauT family transport system substrate-binding protein